MNIVKYRIIWNYYNALVCEIQVDNAIYSGIDGLQLIFGPWIRIQSPFFAIRSEICAVASFDFFLCENLRFRAFFEIYNFKKIYSVLIWNENENYSSLQKKNSSKSDQNFAIFFKNLFYLFAIILKFGKRSFSYSWKNNDSK